MKFLLREWRKLYAPHSHEDDDLFGSPEWRKTRRAVFYRDNYHCLRCEKRFKTEDLTAHHLLPRSAGGSNDETNLVTLCNPCHDLVEVADLRTPAAIIGSYEKPEVELKSEPEPEDDDGRPKWHKWVYGGVRRRL